MRRRSRIQSDFVEIDLTPMIDVVFLMIVFFVVTMNVDESNMREDIELQESPNSIEEPDKRNLTIQVTGRGRYWVALNSYDARGLKRMLKAACRETGGTLPIVISADRRTPHRFVRKVMDYCSSAGFKSVRFSALKNNSA